MGSFVTARLRALCNRTLAGLTSSVSGMAMLHMAVPRTLSAIRHTAYGSGGKP